MKYMIMMFGSAGEMMDVKSPEWIREMIQFMQQLDVDLRDSGEMVFNAGLADGSAAKTVRLTDGLPVATDGPYAETKEQLGGILVLEARDMNHAVQLIGQHPALTYGNIFEIRPAGDMNEIMKASEQRRRKNTAR